MGKSVGKPDKIALPKLLTRLESIAEEIVANSDSNKDIMLYGEITSAVQRIKAVLEAASDDGKDCEPRKNR